MFIVHIVCVHGYEYNHTWFRNTIVTEHDWVCDKELYMYNTFVFDRVGEIFGSFVFGQLGDQYVINLNILSPIAIQY